MSDDRHPAFDRVPPKNRWTGSRLDALFHRLTTEAKAKPVTPADVSKDKWFAWRILRRGAVVALRYRPEFDHRYELRIARVDAPTEEEAWKRWEFEVSTFLRHFAINCVDGDTPAGVPAGKDWYRVREEPRDEGKAAARFIELRQAEVKPGKAICHDCLHETGDLNEIPWVPGPTEDQLCVRHRIRKGRAADAEKAGARR